MTAAGLTLVPDQWYGWQMLPGYGPAGLGAYFSPIRVERVTPRKTGRGILHLEFVNALYAAGVQDFALDLRILRHERDYLVASILSGEGGPTDRTAVISTISLQWIARMCPQLASAAEAELAAENSRSDNGRSDIAGFLNRALADW